MAPFEGLDLKKCLKITVLMGVPLIFWSGSLFFFPVPWPDDSAFVLTGLEWVRSPYLYRMHSQAGWMAGYDDANFNTMPFLPLLMGLASFVFKSLHSMRLFGVLIFGGCLVGIERLFSALTLEDSKKKTTLWILLLGMLFSSTLRWGFMLIRPEGWICVIWVLMLLEWSRAHQAENFSYSILLWKIAFLLAWGAYIHFEAIVWVLPVAFLLLPLEKEGQAQALLLLWCRRLWAVSWRVLILLSPWFAYIFLHWEAFQDQMQFQFMRLARSGLFLDTDGGFWNSFFSTHGMPVEPPPIYGGVKILFWVLLGGSLFWNLQQGLKRSWPLWVRSLLLAQGVALASAVSLFISHPETWFTTVVHFSVWISLACVLLTLQKPYQKFFLGILLSVILGGEVLTTATQWWESRERYTWKQYSAWVDCIDQTIGPRKQIWGTYYPDVLVELALRNPSREFRRNVDFAGLEPLLQYFGTTQEVIIHSFHFPDPEFSLSPTDYQGPPRLADREFFRTSRLVEFQHPHALKLKNWNMKICQVGPFWAAVSYKD